MRMEGTAKCPSLLNYNWLSNSAPMISIILMSIFDYFFRRTYINPLALSTDGWIRLSLVFPIIFVIQANNDWNRRKGIAREAPLTEENYNSAYLTIFLSYALCGLIVAFWAVTNALNVAPTSFIFVSGFLVLGVLTFLLVILLRFL